MDTLSVSHSGVRLLQRERDVIEPDNFHVLNHFRLEGDDAEIEVKGESEREIERVSEMMRVIET